MPALENAAPKVYEKSTTRIVTKEELDDNVVDAIDAREIFDLIRDINDPEHPLTLEQLNVVEEEKIQVDDAKNSVVIHFTPTIPRCTMATLIGLAIRVKLLRSLPTRFKVEIFITPETHSSEE